MTEAWRNGFDRATGMADASGIVGVQMQLPGQVLQFQAPRHPFGIDNPGSVAEPSTRGGPAACLPDHAHRQ